MTIQPSSNAVRLHPDGPTRRPFLIALPEPDLRLDQDAEWCLVQIEGRDDWMEVRFHDYGDVYDIPGLYEHIFYKTLGCNSPQVICKQLSEAMRETGHDPSELRVLDLGAGNGMVGERLSQIGVPTVVGIDIVEAAGRACQRDRPGIYDRYFVADMTDLSVNERAALQNYRFNGMTCVAALGFGDIPTSVFLEAFNLVANGGWVAFNIKEDFLSDRDPSGFSHLISSMIERGDLDVLRKTRYVHRKSTNGEELHYETIISRKHNDVVIDD